MLQKVNHSQSKSARAGGTVVGGNLQRFFSGELTGPLGGVERSRDGSCFARLFGHLLTVLWQTNLNLHLVICCVDLLRMKPG